nr:hypothetical protein [Treponema sp. Marseille-Q3903]
MQIFFKAAFPESSVTGRTSFEPEPNGLKYEDKTADCVSRKHSLQKGNPPSSLAFKGKSAHLAV